MSVTSDYTTVRSTAAVYTLSAPIVRVTGDDRLSYLDSFLSRSADFVEPDTTRECLALNADGSPFAILLHLEGNDDSWLIPRTPVSAEVLDAYLTELAPPAGVEVTLEPEGWGAVAVEGPLAWKVAEPFVDFDISGLVLHAITEVELPGAEDATAVLARVGTTGEYGYLLLSDAPEVAAAAILAGAEAVGGGTVQAAGLARVQAEAGMPYYSQGFGGLDAGVADLAWMISWDRVGDFHGSDELVAPDLGSDRLFPLVAAAGSELTPGTPVLAGDLAVGEVLWVLPAGNPDEELVFAVLHAPFWVPGLPLSAADVPLSTVSLPRVLARSAQHKIG